MTLQDPSALRQFLDMQGIVHERWSPDRHLPSRATDEQVLAAYDYRLKPFMNKGGYQTVDVIRVDGQTPNLEGIREKFTREHTHSEDEVRIFVEGQRGLSIFFAATFIENHGFRLGRNFVVTRPQLSEKVLQPPPEPSGAPGWAIALYQRGVEEGCVIACPGIIIRLG